MAIAPARISTMLMKSKSLILVAVLVGGLATTGLLAADRATESTSAPGWQHLAMETGRSTSDPTLAGKINKLGRDGWELVTVVPLNEDGTTRNLIYYFKRPQK